MSGIGWAAGDGPALAEDVVLEASALRRPVRDRDAAEAIGPTGTVIGGVTVLTRDADGRIAHVAIHHRPLGALLEFSRELGRRTAGRVPAGSFADGEECGRALPRGHR